MTKKRMGQSPRMPGSNDKTRKSYYKKTNAAEELAAEKREMKLRKTGKFQFWQKTEIRRDIYRVYLFLHDWSFCKQIIVPACELPYYEEKYEKVDWLTIWNCYKKQL